MGNRVELGAIGQLWATVQACERLRCPRPVPNASPCPNVLARALESRGGSDEPDRRLQQIDGIQVFYGLGNFVFDQWPRDHQQGVILQVRFVGTHYEGYELIPTHVDKDGQVHLAAPDEAAEILERIRQVSEDLVP